MSAQPAEKMRPHALREANAANPSRSTTCPICGCQRPKNRPWSTYCSDKCRRAAWRLKKDAEIPADIRATLGRIETLLTRLIDLCQGGQP